VVAFTCIIPAVSLLRGVVVSHRKIIPETDTDLGKCEEYIVSESVAPYTTAN